MSTKFLLATVAGLAVSSAAFAQNADYPPEADAGACFARVLIPEATEVVTEQVIDRPEATEVNVIPARYETFTEQVLVKEETVEYRTVPAVYESVSTQVLVEQERTETIVIPAEYETYTEEVLVRDAYTTWKPGAGLYGRASDPNGVSVDGSAVATGELLCKVVVPAQYDTVTRTRIKAPERTEVNIIPARYETVTKEVVSQPAQVLEEVVPAVYEEKTVERLVSPATQENIIIPATYKTVEKRVVTGGGGLEWREVLCDTNTTKAKIREVQAALTAAGFATTADGDFGPGTQRAMESYQRSKGLATGYLTVDTVKSLGVSPY